MFLAVFVVAGPDPRLVKIGSDKPRRYTARGRWKGWARKLAGFGVLENWWTAFSLFGPGPRMRVS